MRVLFILKKNETYGFVSYQKRSSGLWNSTQFVAQALTRNNICSKVVEVIDNNCIDKEVALFRPDVVIIEALWVVPAKFNILMKLHPMVKWMIHTHSGLPFLALEGIAISWLRAYYALGITIIANRKAIYDSYQAFLHGPGALVYLPNVYSLKELKSEACENEYVNISCLGAIRPFKNQLFQALVAIEFASAIGKKLRFHMNGTRIETGGEPVLNNIMALFKDDPSRELVLIPWLDQVDLLDYLQKYIDIGMQISMAETFNIVAADCIAAGVPIVVSDQISWASKLSQAPDDNIDRAVSCMLRAYKNDSLLWWNRVLLRRYSEKAERIWINYLLDL